MFRGLRLVQEAPSWVLIPPQQPQFSWGGGQVSFTLIEGNSALCFRVIKAGFGRSRGGAGPTRPVPIGASSPGLGFWLGRSSLHSLPGHCQGQGWW